MHSTANEQDLCPLTLLSIFWGVLLLFVSFGASFVLGLICVGLGLVRTSDCCGSLVLGLNDLADAILVLDDEPRVFSRK